MTEFLEPAQFIHTRYDDVRDGNGQPVFERNVFYTSAQVNEKRFCAFRQKRNADSESVFCCASALPFQGDRLCKEHFKEWINAKNKKQEEREQRHQNWFDRECQKSYEQLEKMQKNAHVYSEDGDFVGALEYNNADEKEAVMWQLAEALVQLRDNYAQ